MDIQPTDRDEPSQQRFHNLILTAQRQASVANRTNLSSCNSEVASANRSGASEETTRDAAAMRLLPAGSIPGYELVREVHRGGQGIVFEAVQRSTRRRVAVKVMREGPFAGAADRARFDREVQILAQLSHPNIIAIHDSGEAAGHFYFVMEFIEGPSLETFAAASGRTIRPMLELFAKVCDAVNVAHLLGIIHRDLKPGNIRVGADGEPRVLDFGLAKRTILDGLVGPHSAQTVTGQFVGSLPWASPEQARGASDLIGPPSDVYSLGVVLFHLLTGHFPYQVIGTLSEISANIQTVGPTPPSRLVRQIDDELSTIVLKCLSKEIDRRYRTAGELASDLRHYLAGEPIEAKRDSTLYLLRKTVRRHRAPIAVLTAFILLLVGSAVVAWTLSILARHAAAEARQAQKDATDQLWQSYLDQARLKRHSGLAGQRIDTLGIIEKAARIRPSGELRNEAIAALAMPDICVRPPFLRNIASTFWSVDESLRRCAILHNDGSLIVVSTDDCRTIWRMPESAGPARNWPLLSHDGRYLVTQHRTPGPKDHLNVWNMGDGRLLFEIPDTQGCHPDISSDGHRLAVGGFDHLVRNYELPSGEKLAPLQTLNACIAVRFDPTGRRLATFGEESRVVEIYDIGAGRPPVSLKHTEGVVIVGWNPDGRLLAVAGLEGRITIWDMPAGQIRSTLLGHVNSVLTVQFSHNGRWLLSTGWDSSRLWDLTTDREILRTSPNLAHFDNNDEKFLYTPVMSDHRSFALADFIRPAGLSMMSGKSTQLRASRRDGCFSPDGRILLSAAYDTVGRGGLRIFDHAARKELILLDIGDTRCVRFNQPGDSLFTSGERGFFRWPVRTDGDVVKIGPPRRFTDDRGRFDFTRDGRSCAILGGPDKWRLTVFDVGAPSNRRYFICPYGTAYVRFSPSGRWVAVSTWNGGSIEVWDLRIGEHVLSRPTMGSASVAFSPDDKHLIYDDDNQIYFLRTGSWLVDLKIPVGNGHFLLVSPDGHILAAREDTADLIGRVRLIDLERLETMAVLEAPDTRPTLGLAFSPDGNELAVLPWESNTIHLWDLRTINTQLASLGLDWKPTSRPSVPRSGQPPHSTQAHDGTTHVEVDLGELATVVSRPKP